MSHPILPLKLADFEHYMLIDDEPDYPMIISVWLDFEGLLDRDKLEQSFQKTVDENPLLHARIEERQQELYWVDSPEPPQFEWTETIPELIRFNLFESPGIHVFGKEENGNTIVRLFVHHSVSDGAGIVHLVDRWLARYQRLVQPADQPPGPKRLALEECSQPGALGNSNANDPNAGIENRDKFGMNFWKYLLRPFQEFCGLIGVTEYFSHRPVAIGPQHVELDPNPDRPLSHQHMVQDFSLEETTQVIRNSKSTKNKINDMMVASILEACQDWLNDHQPDEAHRHIRVMIPMDMRNKKSPEKYVANVVSMTYLDRRPGRYKSIKSICRYAWLEMTAIKLMKLGLTFIHLIRYFRKRGKLKKLLRRDRSVASTTYSNMGPVFSRSPLADSSKKLVVDGIHLEKFNVFPPIRPYTWITAVIVTYANRFAVNWSWCSTALSATDVDRILTRFKHNLLTGFANSTPDNEKEKEKAESK